MRVVNPHNTPRKLPDAPCCAFHGVCVCVCVRGSPKQLVMVVKRGNDRAESFKASQAKAPCAV